MCDTQPYKHILFPYGGDFTGTDGERFFSGLDMVMEEINRTPDVCIRMVYSTSDLYYEEMNKMNLDLPVKYFD